MMISNERYMLLSRKKKPMKNKSEGFKKIMRGKPICTHSSQANLYRLCTKYKKFLNNMKKS